jgi:alpha-glucosidase (family GH31 glycosyl hydrolase)
LLCAILGILLSGPAARAEGGLFEGNPPIVPRWALEPWVWEDTTNTEASAQRLVQGYLDRNIPVGAVLIDSPWATHYNSFEWDPRRYPDPSGMIAGFHAAGVRVILWITGFVNNDAPDYEHVRAQGYSVEAGKNFQWWKGSGIHLDFTNPEAMRWWHSRMDKILDLGIDGWKVDQSADFVTDPVSTSIGSLSRQDFKQYYYADFFDYSTSRNPQFIIFARPYSSREQAAGAPVSRHSVGWSGDFRGDFAGLEAQKNDVYESARLGYGAPGVEVGGYWPVHPDKKSLIRYAQFAALTPLMINGGLNGGEAQHLPWYWDQETVDIYRYYATLHSELVPYLFSYSVEAYIEGLSILREPDSERSQHMLGEEIFVSAITADTEVKLVDFPGGARWIDYWNEGYFYEGGSSSEYDAPLDRYPIFIRAGAVIPLNVRNGVTGHGDETSAGKTTLAIYPAGTTGFTYHQPLGDGTEFTVVRIEVDELSGTIRVDGSAPGDYRLRVKSFARPAAVEGASSWYYDEAAQIVVIDHVGEDFSLTIHGLLGYGTLEGPVEAASPAAVEVPIPAASAETWLHAPLALYRKKFLNVPLCQRRPPTWSCRPIAR